MALMLKLLSYFDTLRVGDEVRALALFLAFAAHCGFGCSFTNPCSGNEKSNV